MGRVMFQCDCGFGFHSSTDNRSYAVHLLPDQSYDEFSERIDGAIETSGPTPREKADACWAWRRFRLAVAWQCPNCGSLFIEDADGRLHRFVPASDEVPRRLFARTAAQNLSSAIADEPAVGYNPTQPPETLP